MLTLFAHFLPDPTTLALEAWHLDNVAATLTLQVTATALQVPCPHCQAPAARVHSGYHRALADVPWGAYAVHIPLQVRKWFCDTPTCPGRIVTERLPTVVAPWARRTLRRAHRLLAYGLALGGRAGARLATRLELPTPPATLLRLVQAAPRAADHWG